MVGTVTGLICIFALFITVQYYKAMKLITHTPKAASTAGCTFDILPKNTT